MIVEFITQLGIFLMMLATSNPLPEAVVITIHPSANPS